MNPRQCATMLLLALSGFVAACASSSEPAGQAVTETQSEVMTATEEPVGPSVGPDPTAESRPSAIPSPEPLPVPTPSDDLRIALGIGESDDQVVTEARERQAAIIACMEAAGHLYEPPPLPDSEPRVLAAEAALDMVELLAGVSPEIVEEDGLSDEASRALYGPGGCIDRHVPRPVVMSESQLVLLVELEERQTSDLRIRELVEERRRCFTLVNESATDWSDLDLYFTESVIDVVSELGIGAPGTVDEESLESARESLDRLAVVEQESVAMVAECVGEVESRISPVVRQIENDFINENLERIPTPTPVSPVVEQVVHDECIETQNYRGGVFETSDFCSLNKILEAVPRTSVECREDDGFDAAVKSAWPDNTAINAVRDEVRFDRTCILGDNRPFILTHSKSVVEELPLPEFGVVIADENGFYRPDILGQVVVESWSQPLISWAATGSDIGPERIGQQVCLVQLSVIDGPGITVLSFDATFNSIETGTKPGFGPSTNLGEAVLYSMSIPGVPNPNQSNPGTWLGLYPDLDGQIYQSVLVVKNQEGC